MRDMIKMVLVLTCLTSLSGLLLASVEQVTRIPIEESILKFEKAPAIDQIFPEHTVSNDPISERFNVEKDGATLQVFPAKLSDGNNAVAFETVDGGGYGGEIGLMVGVNLATDTVIAVRVTTSSETKGFGSKAKEEPDFVSQFAEKNIDTNFALKSENGVIDGISGATVTSVALARAAIDAQKLYRQFKSEIEQQIQ